MSTYSKEELAEMVTKMRDTNHAFYLAAVQTGAHTYIEFCGLMQKYVDVCERACQEGLDFTETSIHSGRGLPVEDHDIEYLAEKFGCIFAGTLNAKPHLWEIFEKAIIGKKQAVKPDVYPIRLTNGELNMQGLGFIATSAAIVFDNLAENIDKPDSGGWAMIEKLISGLEFFSSQEDEPTLWLNRETRFWCDVFTEEMTGKHNDNPKEKIQLLHQVASDAARMLREKKRSRDLMQLCLKIARCSMAHHARVSRRYPR